MGLFSFIGSLFGGGAQKRASHQAESDYIAYQQKALDQQQSQFAQTRQDNMPYITEGGKAIGAQGNLTGLNGDPAQQAAITNIQNSPYYESLYRNGLEANLQNASATGGMRGGNEQRGLADFGRDTLSQSIQQQLQNLGGISGMGQSSALGLGSLSQANANAQSDIYGKQGTMRAGQLLNRGSITAGMWGQAGNFADQVASAIGGGMGGGAGGAGGFGQFLGQLGSMGGQGGSGGFNLGQLFGAAPTRVGY